MRKPLIVGAQKLYLALEDATEFAKLLKSTVGDKRFPFDLGVCPSFINLAHVARVLEGSRIEVAAQNVHQERLGAFTGQVAIEELQPLGVRYVVLGHSELRSQQGETNEMVNSKVRLCLQKGVTPVVCVGETREERDSGRSTEVIERDVRAVLKGVPAGDAPNVVVAYEPVWAIAGQGGTPATPEVADDMHQFIRRVVTDIYSSDVAQQIRVIYGGSVNPDNSGNFLAQPSVDGLLIGSASVKLESFLAIIEGADRLLAGRPATAP